MLSLVSVLSRDLVEDCSVQLSTSCLTSQNSQGANVSRTQQGKNMNIPRVTKEACLRRNKNVSNMWHHYRALAETYCLYSSCLENRCLLEGSTLKSLPLGNIYIPHGASFHRKLCWHKLLISNSCRN